MRNLFFKKKESDLEHNDVLAIARAGYSFHHTMELFQIWLEEEGTIEDKVTLLDFLMNAIKEDLKTDVFTTILYSEEHFSTNLSRYQFFPYRYYDKKGYAHELEDDCEPTRTVDLTNDCVLVMPWNRKRLSNAIKNIAKTNFEYHPNNHMAIYYTHMDICYVFNGLHSVSAGIGHKKGEIKAKEVDVSKLFNHLHTNGKEWINSHTGKPYDTKVFDFRFAILYEVAKMKYQLINK